MVADAMRDLGQQMNQDADAKQTPAPDLKDLKQRGDRLQKEMEGIKNRLDALADARKGMRDDLRKALEQLQRDLLKEAGKLTASASWSSSATFIAQMREQMKHLQDKQEELLEDAARTARTSRHSSRSKKTSTSKSRHMLAKARKMLGDQRKRKGDKPEFPDSPYTPDGKEVKVPPREEDTNEPLPNKKDKDGKTKPGDKNDKKDADKDDDDKEPLYMPALGGPKEKDGSALRQETPARQAEAEGRQGRSRRATARGDGGSADDQMRDLQAARDSLASDQQTLEQMLQQLAAGHAVARQAGQGPAQRERQRGGPTRQQLQQMMQSPAMQAAHGDGGAHASGAGERQTAEGPALAKPVADARRATCNGGTKNGLREADLSKLDPDTRAMILKLPPSRLRDELIQGMNEQGPEAYRAFIQDYFKRLTETKPASK